ncbi:MAG TPA: PIN domain-containing protein [archaeon]|nr:PIN domain-containing protein [archaeon]
MAYTVDTNIVVAAILRKGDTRRIIFSKNFELYSPDRLEHEVLKHSEEFMKKANMTKEEFLTAVELALENITILPIEEYVLFKEQAQKLCPKGHENDWPFLALALKYDTPLWTNDIALHKQKEVKIVTTKELIEKIDE